MTGLCFARGLSNANRPSALVMTDFDDEVLENLQHNVDINFPPESESELIDDNSFRDNVSTDFVDWRAIQEASDLPESMSPADITLVADCTYSEDIIDHLLRTITIILQCSKKQTQTTSTSIDIDIDADAEASNEIIKKSNIEENVDVDVDVDGGGDFLQQQYKQYGPLVLLAATVRSDNVYQHLLNAIQELNLDTDTKTDSNSKIKVTCDDITKWAQDSIKNFESLFSYSNKNKDKIQFFCLHL